MSHLLQMNELWLGDILGVNERGAQLNADQTFWRRLHLDLRHETVINLEIMNEENT